MSLVSQGFVPAFLHQALTDGDAYFATFADRVYTFADFERTSAAFAKKMAQLGLKRGDRVAIMLRNSPELITCVLAAARAGLVWVPINPELRSESLKYVIEHSQPALLIACNESMAVIDRSGIDLTCFQLVVVDESHAALEPDESKHTELDTSPPAPDALFSIMYTSGTTGMPKGVMVTHKMICYAAEAAALLADVRDGDVLFMWEPMFHVAGAQVLLMPLLRNIHLAMVPRFSASRFWQEVRAARATHIHYLGGVLQILMKRPPAADDKEHTVRVAWGAGCSAEIWEPFQKRFGVQIRESYGMTETSSIASFNGTGKVASVGVAVPWFDIKIIDAQGKSALPNEKGEIVVSSKEAGSLFTGYFRNEDATNAVLQDGCVYTKDIGSFDERGDLFFHGRMTDSMRCRGENVSAWEIEHAVSSHPSVEGCAAIGIEAEIGEQEIKLFVQFKTNAAITPQELSEWLEQHLAPYQNPRFIEVVHGFDRTPSQRIMKHTLPRETTNSWDRLRFRPAPTSRPANSQIAS